MRKAVQILALVFLLVSFSSSQGAASISGYLDVGVPPWGQDYDFLFYGLGNINLSGGGTNIVSNDGSWTTNGWPGVVMDKIFFSPASATTGGKFITDVALTISGINGDNPFPAVINPDILPGGSPNTSGAFTGDPNKPDTFTFSDLPVYAIVPYDADIIVPFPTSFAAWDYSNSLYDNIYDIDSRHFSLAEVGTLSLTLSEPPGNYIASGSFTPVGAPVPEPCTMLLLGSGLIGLAGYGRKKFFKK